MLTIRHFIGSFLIFVGFWLASMAVLAKIYGIGNTPVLLASVIQFALMLGIAALFDRLLFNDIVEGDIDDKRQDILRGLGLGIILWVVSFCVMSLELRAFGLTSPIYDSVKEFMGKAGPLGAVMVVAIGPVSEELFFRGVIYRSIANSWGVAAGVILSALVFGLVHFHPLAILPAVITGVILALAYEKTGSLLLAVIAHMTLNAIQMLIYLIF